MNATEDVFSNPLLRNLILKKYVKLKYKDELHMKIKLFMQEEIIKKWFKHCSCELCSLERDRYNINLI